MFDAAQSAPRIAASITSDGMSRLVNSATGLAIERTARGNRDGPAARKLSVLAGRRVKAHLFGKSDIAKNAVIAATGNKIARMMVKARSFLLELRGGRA